MLNIEIIPCLSDNYSYVIVDEETNLVGVIDPSEFESINNFLSKKYKKLDYILNTHHHFDHVNGNKELKLKYNSKIVASKIDREKIPGIDTLVDDQEIWMHESFEAKVIHVPGHTLGHICFYFYKEESIFTGDTLFSLGCGRIFEGTYSQMFHSLKKLKKLPKNTKIFCGHEYTKLNSKFCMTNDKNNENLKAKINDMELKLKSGLPTIPSTIKDELECNIFLRSNNLETFSKLRFLKDNF